ncbi:MgtC/SapB family protein [Ciceribacter sp. L1K23]|uniref:MgtC/SapB family protein n=1 Tax=Ciceribacter sp. L1K23 TaxID=2820276 RepID=UPI001B82C6C8|nr:MgtC/SapB family protein [Ciceribacter sp. L1K23]MBR0556924.1 MgtC/SapB family protein [Ciceribacter sp. L1K23]
MDALIADFTHPTFLDPLAMAARMLLALVCGAVVGFEREYKSHAAGLRTHILVSMAAAVIALVAIEITHLPTFGGTEIRIDPIRLIEAVTSGVAFLAAGMIVFNRGRVLGLTTGAGMWLAGAIGLACGLGFWQVAALATIAAVIVLSLLRRVEFRLDLKDRKKREQEGTATRSDE